MFVKLEDKRDFVGLFLNYFSELEILPMMTITHLGPCMLFYIILPKIVKQNH